LWPQDGECLEFETVEVVSARPRRSSEVEELEGKVAVVTGAASGQGKATALRLAREGAAIAAIDMNARGAEAVGEEVRALGGKAIALRADIGLEGEVREAFRAVRDSLGPAYVLAEAAGIWPAPRHVTALKPEELERVFAVNVYGAFYCVREAARHMLETGAGGRIVLWSSGGARTASAGASIYDSSKGAVEAMARSIAADLGPHGIAVNVIAPGLVDTPMSVGTDLELYGRILPAGRVGSAQDVAELAAFLASPRLRFLTGAVVDIDGGSAAVNGMLATVRHFSSQGENIHAR
jgi:NAD(P)-dependent dehydrogenase (short-subunit alcohol dehydrogenase family)